MVAFQVADLFETDVGEATLVIQGTPLRWESSGGWRRMQATELSNLP
jgi:hypothetical protein